MKFITDNQGWVLLLILVAVGYMAYNHWDEKKKSQSLPSAS